MPLSFCLSVAGPTSGSRFAGTVGAQRFLTGICVSLALLEAAGLPVIMGVISDPLPTFSIRTVPWSSSQVQTAHSGTRPAAPSNTEDGPDADPLTYA